MDDAFRDAVIDELYVHEERFAAPSLGIDAARVLAHALRARRIQLCWAGAVLLLWVGAVLLSQGLAALYFVPVVLMALARFVRRAPVPQWLSRPVAFLLRWYGRISLAVTLLTFLFAAFGGTFQLMGGLSGLFGWSDDDSYGTYSSAGDFEWTGDGMGASGYGSGLAPVWIALLFPVAVAGIVGLQRGKFARVLAAELSRAEFPNLLRDPAEGHTGARFQRLRERVRAEQHGPLVMYRPAEPFRGAGTAFRTWSLSVELRPRKDRKAEPLDNSAILARIVPLVAALRVPSPHGSPQAQAAVRDRLRELEMDECVFLPAEGLPHRGAAPYAPAAFEEHRAAAVEEGGEPRRHFLRIRVGGWNESIVTTVFVRVHTQGGMLMLEVAPHVLWSLRQLFQDADRIAHQYRHLNPFGKAVWALTRTPQAAGRAVSTLARGLWSVWRLATAGYGAALPDGPAASVRELGTDEEASLFQEMDVARYLRTIEQRVAAGVTTALREAGYETDEFERRVVHVAEGGVYVESAQGAVGIGDHNTVTHHTQRGSTTTEGARGGNG
ncbi:hypothetical protein ACIBK8_17595 [Streptomyces sp. NPDC050161]|uniref:hypothetical protein n=1 Tax=Streptomyces sp. NPDC050161 TaxID=3365604 RepID=UPI0037B46B67